MYTKHTYTYIYNYVFFSNTAGRFGTQFLPRHTTSEYKLDISKHYRKLSEFSNWFQLNCSFLRFITNFTVTVYGFCAAVLKQS